MISDQVLSIEQMQHLISLGVDVSKASMIWMQFKNSTDEWIEDGITKNHFAIDENSEIETILTIREGNEELYNDLQWDNSYICYNIVPTFTLLDILNLFPLGIDSSAKYSRYIYYNLLISGILYNGYTISYKSNHDPECEIIKFTGSNLLELAYNMLCWLAKYKYIPLINKTI